MTDIINPAKEIKTHIGRARIYLNKRQALRCMAEVLNAVKIHIGHQKRIIGPEKFEIEYALDELMTGLSVLPELQPYLSEPLAYKRGKERVAFSQMVDMLQRISKDLENGDDGADAEAEARKKRDAMLARLEGFLQKGDQIMAASCIKKLLAESNGDAYVLMDVADRFYRIKDWRSVLQYTLEAIRKNPKEMRAYKLAINAHRYLSEYEQAQGLYQKAITVFGHHPNIYVNLAKLYQEWGKPEQAFDAARNALKLDPADEDARAMTAVLAEALGRDPKLNGASIMPEVNAPPA